MGRGVLGDAGERERVGVSVTRSGGSCGRSGGFVRGNGDDPDPDLDRWGKWGVVALGLDRGGGYGGGEWGAGWAGLAARWPAGPWPSGGGGGVFFFFFFLIFFKFFF